MIRREIDFILDDGLEITCAGNIVDGWIEDLDVDGHDLPEHVVQHICELLLDQED